MSQSEQMVALYNRFMKNSKLRKRMTNLDPNSHEFYAFVSRFDKNSDGSLDNVEFNAAARILRSINKINEDTLAVLKDIMKMLDFNKNACIDPVEQEKLFNLFDEYASLISDNDTLTLDELIALLERLKAADVDGSGLVEKSERKNNNL